MKPYEFCDSCDSLIYLAIRRCQQRDTLKRINALQQHLFNGYTAEIETNIKTTIQEFKKPPTLPCKPTTTPRYTYE